MHQLTAIEIYTDAVRWWGFLAGIIGLDDFRRRVVAWRKERRWLPVRQMWIDSSAKAMVCIFLLLAGFSIPLTSRMPGFSSDDARFLAIMATAWSSVAGAGWAYVISRAYRPRVLILTGAIALVACLFASILTAQGG
ncbi:hypothetical protein [Novosphingobium sp. KN65.2]|uniref:hypothetical protein n=1 Tax=Novosphingobium sp. KN65.2 TaxID=1478134 RepID=UPI0005E5F439|nr:hypothetical protein [Novosphingobium sp. KN65.2]CDO34035.1 membrane hypothetical protein [Novosphingobium sp. KN65.2]